MQNQPASPERFNTDINYELDILGAMKAQIKGDPNCKRSGCYGRGVLGIKIVTTKDRKIPTLITCDCAILGTNDYTRLKDEISNLHSEMKKQFLLLNERMNNHFLTVDDHQIDLYHGLPSGFIVWKLDELRTAIKSLWRGWRSRKRNPLEINDTETKAMVKNPNV